MMKTRMLTVLICTSFFLTQSAYAQGLSTAFGRVRVDNIKTGQRYSLKDDAKMPFMIKNTSNIDLELRIDVIAPKEDELVRGYEAIPDVSWIKLEETDFILPPESEISTDIIINIPDDDVYKKKKYQAYIWSHTKGPVAVGLKSKFLLSTAE